jgi:hypothetical protein
MAKNQRTGTVVMIQRFGERFNESRQLRMAAVAERRALRVLAAAPRNGLCHGDFRFQWREACALVRAVAKRLAFGMAAGTPVISAGFNLLDDWGSLSYCRFHNE